MSYFARALAVCSIVALSAVGALAQTADALPAEQAQALTAAATPAACRDAAMLILDKDAALLEKVSRFAVANCPDNSIATLAEALAQRFPEQIEDIAVWMTSARPDAVGEIVLSLVGVLPEEQRLAAFERIIERIRREIPGIVDSEAFTAVPGIGELTGPAFAPYSFPLLLEEEQGPGNGVSPS